MLRFSVSVDGLLENPRGIAWFFSVEGLLFSSSRQLSLRLAEWPLMGTKMNYHPHGSVLFCTFSLEEGLLLLANPLCQAIVKTCLARACELYTVRISHIIGEATHIHLVLEVINPDHVEAFFRHFKTDSAHMINGLLGRNKRTVWCEGYDSPIVLTPKRALIAIAYLYANPAKDNLETSIDRYPGFSKDRKIDRFFVSS